MAKHIGKRERRRQIIEAAMQCFAQGGYENTAMSDIAKVAGVSKGTVYNYYEDKKQLFLSILSFYAEEYMQGFDEFLESPESSEQKLRALVQSMASMTDVPELQQLSSITVDFYAHMRFDEEVNETLRSYFEPFVGLVTAIIQQGIDKGDFRPVNARQIAIGILGTLDGMGIYDIMNIERFNIVDDSLAFLEVVLSGLKTADSS